jgi:hypothetical protein
LTSYKDTRASKIWQFVSTLWKPASGLAKIGYTLQQLGLNKATKNAAINVIDAIRYLFFLTYEFMLTTTQFPSTSHITAARK